MSLKTINRDMTEYGVATMSRLLNIIGLFCRISSLSCGSFAKETYNFKEPTNRSHHILGVGSINNQVSFANEIYKNRTVLPKRSDHSVVSLSVAILYVIYHTRLE